MSVEATKPAAFKGAEPCDGCGEDNPATRGCPCGRRYCGHCECDCADWHLVVHEGHEGGYAACLMPDCVRLAAEATKPAYVLRDDLDDDWHVQELAQKIENGRVEDFALVIRVLTARMASKAIDEDAMARRPMRDEISFFGDLGKAVDSIAAAVCDGLRTNADDDYPEQVAHVETTLAALRTAADGLAEVAEGWI